MDKRSLRLGGLFVVWILGCVIWLWGGEQIASASTGQWTVPEAPPVLLNAGFECTEGFTLTQNAVGKDIWIPNHWQVIFVSGSPRLLSTRMSVTGRCDPNSSGHVTRQEGHDSWYFPSQDIATPPEPGKPFDLVLYQTFSATVGAEYSLSGWFASECGDHPSGPKPCPLGQYVAKMIGIDPNGGTDPSSPSIEWVENRNDRHWQNLYTSTRALSETVTVFARIVSPFQFHNNKGFVDAFSLVRAPLSMLNPLPPVVEEVGTLELSWIGRQSIDIARIPGGNYDLLFDVQVRSLPRGEWHNLVTGSKEEGRYLFKAPCVGASYQFRVRARAEQPEDKGGSSPNHRYPGVWSKPQTVRFTAPPAPPISDTELISPSIPFSETIYLPTAARTTLKEC